jgi:hypothetical protein
MLGTTTASGTVDAGPFVIHWSASDPTDRALWTNQSVYPLTVTPGADGGTFISFSAPRTSGCWELYPTADPDALRAQACDQPLSSGAPARGTFRRGPRLLTEIPVPPLATTGLLPPVVIATGPLGGGGVGGGGDWVVYGVGSELWFWKKDTGQIFDLGSGTTSVVSISPDGRRVMFVRSIPHVVSPLMAFDAMTGEETNLTATVPESATEMGGTGGIFSPDGGKAAFYANHDLGGIAADLVVYDFTSRQAVTVAQQLDASDWWDQTVYFLAGGDHLLYVGHAGSSFSTSSIPIYGYELSTGKRLTFGESVDLVPIPGGAFAAVWNLADGLLLVDDATFTPHLIAALSSGGQAVGGGGLAPSPDGAELAYVDTSQVLNIRNLAKGTTLTVADDASNFGLPDPFSIPNSGHTRGFAAWFAADGAIVHAVGQNPYGFARYDRATGKETTFPTPTDGGRIYAMSPLGSVVIDNPTSPTMLAWPGPPVSIDAVIPNILNEVVFVFSASDRYLSYTTNGAFMARDNQSAKVTKIAQVGMSVSPLINPANGVAVALNQPAPFLAYLPDGTSWQVAPSVTWMTPNPTTSEIAFVTGDAGGSATYTLPLQPSATPAMIGNGSPLVITATQVIFQDIDGICASPL